MNNKSITCCLTILLVITLSSSISPVCAIGKAGTTLTASITATGFNEIQKTYDWTITKTMTPTELELKNGKTSQIDATKIATRQLTTETNVCNVRGAVTVTNGGAIATENLQVTVVVQYKTGSGKFQDLAGASTNLIVDSQLQAGQTKTYQYSIQYTPVRNAQYRIVAYVKITNHSGHIGSLFGPEPKAGYTLPSSATSQVNVDATAELTDDIVCPEGFSYSSSDTGPWHLTDSTTISYFIDLTNDAAEPQRIYTLTNTATITKDTTSQQHTDTATVTIHPSMFQVPEYWMGGLGALLACVVAFGAFRLTQRKKRPNSLFGV